jgi:hypothetical protein
MPSGRTDLLWSCGLYDCLRCRRHLPADSVATAVERETSTEGGRGMLVPARTVHYPLLHSTSNSDSSRGGCGWGFYHVSPLGHNRIQCRGELVQKFER